MASSGNADQLLPSLGGQIDLKLASEAHTPDVEQTFYHELVDNAPE